jgi:CheY-like chemotaxis protein
LSNAVKYTNTGSITFQVSGQMQDNERMFLSFRITDTGIGIKSEDMDKLFGNFNQVDTHRNRGIEGTGLGLAISRNLCRLMGGDITVQSVYGEGSTFTAAIPQRVVDPSPFGSVELPAAAHPGGEQAEMKFIAPEVHILAVDDIDTNLTVLKGLLSPYQMEISLCTSGADAIELVKKQTFDFVLMDHMMPGMDGIEATAAIRKWEEEQRKNAIGFPEHKQDEGLVKTPGGVPIIALTANAVTGMKEMFLEKGFNDYLSKPIEIAKLDDLISRWVPLEKRIKAGDGTMRDPFSGSPAIPGIDTAKGISMTGGTLEGYKNVLAAFCKDALKRLPVLQPILKSAPGAADLVNFTIHVHALKSAAGTIGAAELSREAAELETAGNAGDINTISEKLPGFYEHLKETAEAIQVSMADDETANADGDGKPGLGVSDTGVRALFLELKAALEAKDMEATDRVTGELAHTNLDKAAKETLDAVSDLLLLSKFKQAVKKLEIFCGP